MNLKTRGVLVFLSTLTSIMVIIYVLISYLLNPRETKSAIKPENPVATNQLSDNERITVISHENGTIALIQRYNQKNGDVLELLRDPDAVMRAVFNFSQEKKARILSVSPFNRTINGTNTIVWGAFIVYEPLSKKPEAIAFAE